MPIKFYKLFDILQRRELKKTDLIKIANISSPTLAKLSKGETVTTEVIEKICNALDTQPGDIMEYLNESAIISSRPHQLIKVKEPAKTKAEQAEQAAPEEEHITLPWEE